MSSIDPVRVGVVMLNWNGIEDTLRCLKSLNSSIHASIICDVIVVDNGSDVDPSAILRANFPAVESLRLEKNAGFAAGSNLGARRAMEKGAEFILFINNDTTAAGGFLPPLIAAARDSNAVAGPLIRDMDDPSRIDFAGAHINLSAGRFRHSDATPVSNEPFETDYISGCCLLMSRATAQKLGMFDEKLFAYFEDVDLCLRARQTGIRLVCVPAAVIYHKGSASTRARLKQGSTSAMKHYLIARNRIVIVRRYGALLARFVHLFLVTPLRTLFYVAGFIAKARWQKMQWHLRGVCDGCCNRLGPPPFSSDSQ